MWASGLTACIRGPSGHTIVWPMTSWTMVHQVSGGGKDRYVILSQWVNYSKAHWVFDNLGQLLEN